MCLKKIIPCLLFLVACGKNHEAIRPLESKITESVYSSVTIQPDSLYNVYSAVNGILDVNLKEEGDLIKKGEPILQIINTSTKLSSDNALLNVKLAQENYQGNFAVLRDIEDEMKAALLRYKNDSINFYRQENLWKQKIGSKLEYDTKKLNYELSTNQLQLLQTKYNRTKNELKTQLEQAQNSYRSSLINTEDFTVDSKISGKVYALFKNPGELVSTMEPIASIGKNDAFVIEMLVDEVDIVKLSLGLRALITLDAYGAEVFEAEISKIYPRKDERSQTFKIEAVFVSPPKVLYPGLSGEGNIIIAEKESTLTIPKEYLLEGNKVMTPDGTVSVSIGLQNLDRVEILSGISKETSLLKPE
ncbi:efflux RND transporter periplasmic adaptor subunit [Sediminicola sp. 1XM1-17]|uniref:efflux RND transporter periplasmic adaptor subunit n=1 Tax=Sediminicola sp. 1XM1-17 TaxID=3127702 RepID=UPI003078621E